jgi:hypothetical protein
MIYGVKSTLCGRSGSSRSLRPRRLNLRDAVFLDDIHRTHLEQRIASTQSMLPKPCDLSIDRQYPVALACMHTLFPGLG